MGLKASVGPDMPRTLISMGWPWRSAVAQGGQGPAELGMFGRSSADQPFSDLAPSARLASLLRDVDECIGDEPVLVCAT